MWDGEKAIELRPSDRLRLSEDEGTPAGQPVRYDGVLAGLVRARDGGTGPLCWSFEGKQYDTPADEATVMATVNEALEEPDARGVAAAREFVFGGKAGMTYTSQALLAMLVAYEAECSVDGEVEGGVAAVAGILPEAARRIAVVEAFKV